MPTAEDTIVVGVSLRLWLQVWPRLAYSWLLYCKRLESILEGVCENLHRSESDMVSCWMRTEPRDECLYAPLPGEHLRPCSQRWISQAFCPLPSWRCSCPCETCCWPSEKVKGCVVRPGWRFLVGRFALRQLMGDSTLLAGLRSKFLTAVKLRCWRGSRWGQRALSVPLSVIEQSIYDL